MKSGLITYHDATNYGAALQTVATYKVFKERCDLFVVDYYNPVISKQMHIVNTVSLRKSIHDILRIRVRHKTIKNFKSFLTDNVRMTEKCSTKEQLARVLKDYELLISGSDQVWNPECQTYSDNLDYVYFLDIDGSFKRASYASSFGDYRYAPKQEEKVIDLLSRYESLSVREEDAVTYLESRLSKPVDHVLDPTLLLDQEDWVQMARPVDLNLPEKYVLVYQLNKNRLNNIAIDRAKELAGTDKVVVIDQGFFERYAGAVQVRTAGPAEFIYLLSNAEIVVTDSFHGACFSLNFRKKFIVVAPPKRANRMESLFNKLGIIDRLIKNEEQLLNSRLFEEDTDAFDKLQLEKNRSLEYINKVIS